ncbi:MAG: BatD family protein [Candidatus Latescibacterota bacterium]
MKQGIFLVAILALLIAPAAFGADITVSSSVSANQVSLSDRLELTIAITGPDARKADSPKLDPMPGFHVMGTQQSTEFRFINGKSSTLITYTYTLAPRSTGTHEVGGATITVGGQAFTTRATKVEVIAGSPSAPQSPSVPDAGKVEGGSGNADIFIRTEVDNRQPFVGEQITLTFDLFNRLTLWGDTEYDPPSTTGFWAVDLPKITPSTRVANNRMYKYNAMKTALFPTTAGTLTIGPATLTYTTGGFFSPQETRTIKTRPITVRAKALPEEERPAGFTGAVGSFRIGSTVDKETLRAGDVITITITVSGEGNLDLLTALTTPDLSAFRAYDPKVTTQALNSGFVVGGAKIWQYVLMPKLPGTIVLPPFSLSFFNPGSGKYQTVSTSPVTLRVTPGDPSLAFGGKTENEQNTVETVARDINFIKPDKLTLTSVNRQLYLNPVFFFFYFLPIGIFAAAVIIKRRHDAIEQDRGLKRKVNAWRHAQKRLEQAAKAEGAGNPAEFCGHLSESVVRFIGDRLNLDAGALTAGDLEERLQCAGVAPDTATRVRRTLELCDFARFSSTGSDHGLRQKLLADTKEMLTTLRDVI